MPHEVIQAHMMRLSVLTAIQTPDYSHASMVLVPRLVNPNLQTLRLFTCTWCKTGQYIGRRITVPLLASRPDLPLYVTTSRQPQQGYCGLPLASLDKHTDD